LFGKLLKDQNWDQLLILYISMKDIQTTIEYRQQTLVGFLDIFGAYDNVLIDIFCKQMHQAQLPLKIVRVMWNVLWRKKNSVSLGKHTSGGVYGAQRPPAWVDAWVSILKRISKL
jgi:hypothetical protein